jgi:hypothetical protein
VFVGESLHPCGRGSGFWLACFASSQPSNTLSSQPPDQ